MPWPAYPVLFGAPWIVGIVYYWRKIPRDGSIPPSLADRVRRQLGLF
jgi:hypothetical protein